MASTTWYHGGNLQDGEPKGTYLYVTDELRFAKAHAGEHRIERLADTRSDPIIATEQSFGRPPGALPPDPRDFFEA
jgi:hypothetical protein